MARSSGECAVFSRIPIDSATARAGVDHFRQRRATVKPVCVRTPRHASVTTKRRLTASENSDLRRRSRMISAHFAPLLLTPCDPPKNLQSIVYFPVAHTEKPARTNRHRSIASRILRPGKSIHYRVNHRQHPSRLRFVGIAGRHKISKTDVQQNCCPSWGDHVVVERDCPSYPCYFPRYRR